MNNQAKARLAQTLTMTQLVSGYIPGRQKGGQGEDGEHIRETRAGCSGRQRMAGRSAARMGCGMHARDGVYKAGK